MSQQPKFPLYWSRLGFSPDFAWTWKKILLVFIPQRQRILFCENIINLHIIEWYKEGVAVDKEPIHFSKNYFNNKKFREELIA
jgi:hypothetical protein